VVDSDAEMSKAQSGKENARDAKADAFDVNAPDCQTNKSHQTQHQKRMRRSVALPQIYQPAHKSSQYL
jgi:hypothetical protein